MSMLIIKGSSPDLWELLTVKEEEGYKIEDVLLELRTIYYVNTDTLSITREYEIVSIEEKEDHVQEIESLWKDTSIPLTLLHGFSSDDFQNGTKGRISGVKQMEIVHYSRYPSFLVRKE